MANDPGVRLQRGGTGFFQIWMYHPDGRGIDVTLFRGAPTLVQSLSSADPFGDSTASLAFETITSFDTPGAGDLWWLVPYAQVTIFWYDIIDGTPVKNTTWVWEGFMVSEEIGNPYTISCKGTLYIYDNYLAAPFYPSYPVPYEKMIERLFKTLPTKWNKALKLVWPSGWNVKVPAFTDPAYMWFLKPFGVTKGANWSGLTTRNTGGWDPVLTSYIQTLLGTMYTPDGDQWTIMKGYGRQPILKVRQQLLVKDSATLEVHNEAPGVQVSVSRDYSQTANVIYGAGSDLAGSSFSGMQVANDGESTWYEPFAALPQVYPNSPSNPWRIPSMIRKESRLQFTGGVDQDSAVEVAQTQLRRFADPGLLGTVTLTSDPIQSEQVFNRFLITAGMRILVKSLRGADILFHIASVSVSPEDGTVSLSVDTKFRDALTISEVRARTRDALDPVSYLRVGKISAVINDTLKPWSYKDGSGFIPTASTKFHANLAAGSNFPWTSQTKKYPPAKYPQYYVKVSKKGTGTNATNRWQDNGWVQTKVTTSQPAPDDGLAIRFPGRPQSVPGAGNTTVTTARNGISKAIPIRGAQNASIRLVQIMAVDKNGNPLKIRFHVGFYSNSGTDVTAMPMIPAKWKKQKTDVASYAVGQRYPFFANAFNAINLKGEQLDANYLLADGTVMYAAWGTNEEPAGYSPGSYGAGGQVTGMLVDESTWSIDPASNDSNFGINKASDNDYSKNPTAGMFYMMIYQDAVPEAYFIGRCYRAEIGAGG